MYLQRLSAEHLPLADAFRCVETDEMLAKFSSKERRRIKRHSKEMEDFLRQEAFNEQELCMSTTYLLLDDDGKTIFAYISLCGDAIRLEVTERDKEGVCYGSAPALKIARLAVATNQRGLGLGRMMIDFSAYQAQQIRQYAGIFFLTLDCYAHRVSYYQAHGFVKNLLQPIELEYDSPISMRISVDAYLETYAEK